MEFKSKILSFTGIALIGLVIVSAGGLGSAGFFFIQLQQTQGQYNALVSDYEQLLSDYNDEVSAYEELLSDYEELFASHTILTADYEMLNTTYYDLLADYQQLQLDYGALLTTYNNLQNDYDSLFVAYGNLLSSYTTLQNDYNSLNSSYFTLLTNYNSLSEAYLDLWNRHYTLCDWIRNQILPLQICNFGEAVRRYYLPYYLEGLPIADYWTNFTQYLVDVVMHSSQQTNRFLNVSLAMASALKYAGDTMNLEYESLRYVLDIQFYGLLGGVWKYVYWGDASLPNPVGNEVHWREVAYYIHQHVVDMMEYEYDSDITELQYFSSWDYIKFAAETYFREKGDCEDQAIADAAFLESCGYETAIGAFHDDDHPTLGSFYHSVLWINLDFNGNGVVDFSEDPYGWIHWTIKGSPYTWLCLDPTWDVSFGGTPSWLQDYIDAGHTSFPETELHILIVD